jgi:two-component system sensor kinase FixL
MDRGTHPDRSPRPGGAAGAARRRRGRALRYGAAVAAAAVGLAGRYVLRDSLGPDAPFLLFFPAIVLAAWYGGLGPGLLATACSAILAMFALLPPDAPAAGAPAGPVSLAVFVAVGAFISWLNHRLHESRRAHREDAAAAQARAEYLDAILDTTADGIVAIDATGRIEAFNRGAQALFGYAEDEVVGRNVRMLMPSPHHDQHDTFLERYLTTGDARIIGRGREVTGRRRDGTHVPLQLSVGEMRVAGERKFVGMMRDLPRRVRLEEALGASEARWRAIVDSAVDGIVVIDAHGRVEAFNRAAERLFGYPAEEVLGRNVDMLMPSPYREEHDGYLARYLATGRAEIIGTGREVQGRRRDGSTFPLHLSVGEMVMLGERKFTGILHDLSGRVRMEARLREQEALARLGEMAAVIAHEVKNPLAGIRGALQVFRGRAAPDGVERSILDEIVRRIDALDGMMKEMLLFARPPKPARRPTDVVLVVRTTLSLLSGDPALREVEVEVAGAAPPIPADADMLRVVFHNLLINSAHAMEGRGRIRVAVEPADTTCRIAVADAGPGIPPEIREKIFTPFFTTKARGSGLGLPTVKRLVEAHDGEIAVDCPAEGGTTVTIQLPMGGP